MTALRNLSAGLGEMGKKIMAASCPGPAKADEPLAAATDAFQELFSGLPPGEAMMHLPEDMGIGYNRFQDEAKGDGSASRSVLKSARVAAVSLSGVVVCQCFGQAGRLLIYGSDGRNLSQPEIRGLAPGGALGRCGKPGAIGGPPKLQLQPELKPWGAEGLILKMAGARFDCDAALAVRVGDSPRAKLEARGAASLVSRGSAGEAVLAAAKRHMAHRRDDAGSGGSLPVG